MSDLTPSHAELPLRQPEDVAAAQTAAPKPRETRTPVSPHEMRRHRFKTSFRGLDKADVTKFLMAAADDYEDATTEADRLRQEVARLKAIAIDQQEHERSLKQTIVAAQRVADDIRQRADADAARALADAHARAEQLMEQARARVEDVQRDIDGLTLGRREMESALERAIASLRGTLDDLREQDGPADAGSASADEPGEPPSSTS